MLTLTREQAGILFLAFASHGNYSRAQQAGLPNIAATHRDRCDMYLARMGIASLDWLHEYSDHGAATPVKPQAFPMSEVTEDTDGMTVEELADRVAYVI